MPAELKNIVEAVLLVSDAPLSAARIQGLFADDSQPSADEVREAIRQLQAECAERGVELRKIGNGYRYQSRPKYAEWIGKLHATRPPRLSRALLETLAIIAYRQPVTRGDIETIRGVGVTTDIMRRLLEREWIREVGVRDVPGHPSLFATSAEFLSYFGLESLKDLPPLPEQRELGDIAGEVAGQTDTPFPPELLAGLRDPATPEGQERDGANVSVPSAAPDGGQPDEQSEPHPPATPEAAAPENASSEKNITPQGMEQASSES